MNKFDDDFEDGVYAIPSYQKIKVRALWNFCQERNITPSELNEEEMQQFLETKKTTKKETNS
ncbi:hypothetical protein ACT3HK_14495 [Thermolongibacillus altinsuensis]|jgi:hypothetical protein